MTEVPGWVRALPRLSDLSQLRASLRQRLSNHPEALARLPEVQRLGSSVLSHSLLQQHIPSRSCWFRTAPPEQFSAALFSERQGWVLYLPERELSSDAELYLRACLHLWLGHLRPDDEYGLWLELGTQRRWDQEVAELLPTQASPTLTAQQWAGLRFLEHVPWMSEQVPFAPSLLPIRPWPHQRRVARELMQRFPERFLLCDEVGLGKTIETGLALRELLHRQLVQRALLLVPRSVLSQWQEEMREKFNLHFQIVEGPNVNWAAGPLILASSYLVRRENRMRELLRSQPWDLVIVDEAHHARGSQKPNRLLQLLRRLQRRTRGLWLLTATPLQIDLLEVHDLLTLLGIRGEFANPKVFSNYFAHLSGELDLESFQKLAPTHRSFEQEYLELKKDAGANRTWRRHFGEDIPLRICTFLKDPKKDRWEELGPDQKEVLRQILLRRTPLQHSMFRNTRALLRRYYREGLIDQAVATRRVVACPVQLSPSERKLYDHIESYLRDLESAGLRLGVASGERQRLRFITDIYRRRLTSSLRGIQVSLQRRQHRLEDFLQGRGWTEEVTDEEDGLEEDPWDSSPSEQLARLELQALRDFSETLHQQTGDSKRESVEKRIREVLSRRDRVLVFTQYTDTLDSLRDQLCLVYPPSEVGCYTGRGGEVWQNSGWQKVTKETIKTRFHNAGDLRILLCTDAASEGLNFQACGVLINYDLPWNPMRVEQRIGRIDRIGQLHPTLEIYNFFYEDSVEAKIYQQLGARIDLFQSVVGHLQPILARVEQNIKELARVSGSDRDTLARQLDDRLSQELRETQQQAPPIDPEVEEADLTESESADVVSPESLEKMFGLCEMLQPTERAGVYRWRGMEEVTFRPKLADEHPDSIALVTYGDPRFAELRYHMQASRVEESRSWCSVEAWMDPLSIGETRLWDGQRWTQVSTLEQCLSAQPDGAADEPPSGGPVEKRLREHIMQYRNSETMLAGILQGNSYELIQRKLCEGLALHICLRQKRLSLPWEPVLGKLGNLASTRQDLFEPPVLQALLKLLGQCVHGYSLGQESYLPLQEESAAQLQGKWANWMQRTQSWLDEQDAWTVSVDRYTAEVHSAALWPGMKRESE